MSYINAKIIGTGYYIPTNNFSSKDIENKISMSFPKIPFGILEEMTGVKSRYFVGESEYSSDLAIKASEKAIINSGIEKDKIDLLIFASASQDIIEPATANIVQKGLGLKCPVFDIKNACNSFMNGLDIADSFIKSGKYKNVLVCSGETPSKVIKFNVTNKTDFKNYFAGYTFGDAGAAIILTYSNVNNGILWSYFYSDGGDWDIATIMGGGSRFPQDSNKNYFSGNPGLIRDKFISLDYKEFYDGLTYLKWSTDDVKMIFVHQVAMSNFEHLYDNLGFKREKYRIILPEYGNIASCCIPLSLSQAIENKEIVKGDKIIMIGFASGFSYGIIFYEV